MSPPILSSPSLSHHLLWTKNFLCASSGIFFPSHLLAPSASISFMPLPSSSVMLLPPPSPASLSLTRGRNSIARRGNFFCRSFFSFFSSSLHYLSLSFLSSFSLLLSFSSSHAKPLPHLCREISDGRNLLAILFPLLCLADLSSSPFVFFSPLLLLSLSASPIRERNLSVTLEARNQNQTETFCLTIFLPPPVSVWFSFSVSSSVMEIPSQDHFLLPMRPSRAVSTTWASFSFSHQDTRDISRTVWWPARVQPKLHPVSLATSFVNSLCIACKFDIATQLYLTTPSQSATTSHCAGVNCWSTTP